MRGRSKSVSSLRRKRGSVLSMKSRWSYRKSFYERRLPPNNETRLTPPWATRASWLPMIWRSLRWTGRGRGRWSLRSEYILSCSLCVWNDECWLLSHLKGARLFCLKKSSCFIVNICLLFKSILNEFDPSSTANHLGASHTLYRR